MSQAKEKAKQVVDLYYAGKPEKAALAARDCDFNAVLAEVEGRAGAGDGAYEIAFYLMPHARIQDAVKKVEVEIPRLSARWAEFFKNSFLDLSAKMGRRVDEACAHEGHQWDNPAGVKTEIYSETCEQCGHTHGPPEVVYKRFCRQCFEVQSQAKPFKA
jgi:hypothetical protein